MTTKTTAQIQADVADAVRLGMHTATIAATNYLQTELKGNEQMPCGFAWVIVKAKGSTKLGKALTANGFKKAYGPGLQLWNPSKLMVQNVDCLKAGAEAMAKVLQDELGVEAYADSRWD